MRHVPNAMTIAQTEGSPEVAAPRSAWPEVLREATLEVFSKMVGGAIVVPQQADGATSGLDTADAIIEAQVTGIIGIAGAMRAVLSLRCSENAAQTIASQMLGITGEEAAQHKADAIGELCNMVAGHFKHQVGLGGSCTLSVPTIVIGSRYDIHCLEDGERLEFPALYDGGTLLITLDIRGQRVGRI